MVNLFKQFVNMQNITTGVKVILLLFIVAIVWLLLLLVVSQFVDITTLSTGSQVFISIGALLLEVLLLGYIARTYFKIK